MNEKEFIRDIWDLLAGNTHFCTAEQAREKYRDLLVDVECTDLYITLRDDHNEWRLSLQKTWCDETQVKKQKSRVDCAILWKDSTQAECVTISLDGSDDDSIFFVCHSEEEFLALTREDNGEDFTVISYEL